MQIRYSLHKIKNAGKFSFNPADYSRFKFGDDAVAESFGTALAKGFIKEHLQSRTIQDEIVIISSPYSFIPTATYAMKNYFAYELNKWLAENGLPVVQETKIHRTITYKEDYGELNAAERINLISNDRFHIDKSFLQSKTLVFLDDIIITGGHERMIKRMIEEFDLDNEIFLVYFAELANEKIHPNIENTLNYFCVKSVFDLEKIISGGRFSINTRIVKYILSAPFDAFHVFIQNQDIQFLHLLYNMALGNSYHNIDAYRSNLNGVKFLIESSSALKV